jgi:hypothetical protein
MFAITISFLSLSKRSTKLDSKDSREESKQCSDGQ